MRLFKHCPIQRFVSRRQTRGPPGHHLGRRIKVIFQIVIVRQSSFQAADERRHAPRQQAAGQQVAEDAGVRAGVEQRAEAVLV